MNQGMERQTEPSDDGLEKWARPKLPAKAHALCGWPLLLVAIGGAVGGALGGAAYGVNVAIYRSKLPVVAKVVLNLLTGVAAIGIWMVMAVLVQCHK